MLWCTKFFKILDRGYRSINIYVKYILQLKYIVLQLNKPKCVIRHEYKFKS